MSILNAYCDRRLAIVAVDSKLVRDRGDGSGAGESIGLTCKLRLFSHAGALLASSGSAMLGQWIGNLLAYCPVLPDVDAFDSAFSDALARAARHVEQVAEQASLPALGGSRHCLAGWSSTQRRMRAIMYEKSSASAALLRTELEDECEISPWYPEQGPLPFVDTLDAMRVICESQITHGSAIHAMDTGVGRPLVIAEMSREEVRLIRVLQDPRCARGGSHARQLPRGVA